MDFRSILGITGISGVQGVSPSPTTTNIPLSLASLTPGNLTNVLVGQKDANGNQTFITKDGQFSVSTNLNLSEGTQLTVKLLTNTLQNQGLNLADKYLSVQIVTVNGKSLGQPEQASSQLVGQAGINNDDIEQVILIPLMKPGKAGNIATNINLEPNDEVIINKDLVTQAVVVDSSKKALNSNQLTQELKQPGQPVKPDAQAPNQPIQLTKSDIITVKLLTESYVNQIPKDPATQQLFQQLQNGLPASAKTTDTQILLQKSIYQQTPGQPAATQPTLPTVTPPTTPQIPNPVLSGTVIGIENSGEAVIKTEAGILKLLTPTTLTKDTNLRLEIVSLPQNPQGIATPTTISEKINLLEANRTTLSEIINTLKSSDPALAQRLIRSFIPVIDKDNLPAKMLNYARNILTNRPDGGMPAEVRNVLEQAGRHDLIQRFSAEAATFKKASDELPHNWNLLSVPVHDGKELQYINLYYQNNRKRSMEDLKDSRFIVELSILGGIQLDGYFKEKKNKKELDLNLKTRNFLGDKFKSDITQIFIDTTESLGIIGTIKFMFEEDYDLFPTEDEPDDGNSIVV